VPHFSRSSRKVAFASLSGTTIEWYDFFIFGTAAAVVFNQVFFPSFDPVTGTLAAFASFSVGFIARPVGGAVFAHYGDKIGHMPMLVYSLLLMGAATMLMGLLPGYASIGIWAPTLLVLLRFAQGFGVAANGVVLRCWPWSTHPGTGAASTVPGHRSACPPASS
jgi:MFS family permease